MGRTVLIVDDDLDSREALEELLRMWGHDVDLAATGEEAVARTLERRPDVVLLDIGLPDIDGYEVARRIRSALDGDGCSLIALTGSESDGHDGAQAFDAHIVKPAEPEVLRRVVERTRAD